MPRALPAASGPTSPRSQPQTKEMLAAPYRSPVPLAALFPPPAELADDALTCARRLLRGIETTGIRLRRHERAVCMEVVMLVERQESLPWYSAGLVLRLARLHLSPAA
jgi:hypothetical protein